MNKQELIENGRKEVNLRDLRCRINELRRYNTKTTGLLSLEIETVSYRQVLEILDEWERLKDG